MSAGVPIVVRVQAEDFDAAGEAAALARGRTDIGAIVTFTGLCRAEGGRLAAIVGTGNTGTATLWTATADGLSSRREFNASVRLLPGFERQESFVF